MKIYIRSSPEAMANRKEREDRNTNIWTSHKQKKLFRWNKKHFSWLFMGYHWEKKIKLENTSLNSFGFNALNIIFWVVHIPIRKEDISKIKKTKKHIPFHKEYLLYIKKYNINTYLQTFPSSISFALVFRTKCLKKM